MQLALLGIRVTEPGRITVVGSSFWQHTVVLDEPLIDPAAGCGRSATPSLGAG
jgi:hypothetical protein